MWYSIANWPEEPPEAQNQMTKARLTDEFFMAVYCRII
jgi:hypothetical protein